jgi:hypothetical protein
MYRGKYVLFYPVTLNKLTTPSTNHLPRAFVFGICHFYFDSKQFWHPATASGFLTRFWNKTSHGRTLSKKKNSSNQNQSKHCNGTSSWFMNKSSVNRYKWNMIIYQVGMGIRMPMNAQQNDLKQSINEPAVGLYTKRSLPPLFLAWHANFHSSGLTVVLTVRFSSFFPNSHTVAPPVESCFMFIIVYPIGVHLAKEKIPANRNHQSRGHDHNHWIKLLFHPYPLLFFLGGHLFPFFNPTFLTYQGGTT